ncbi:MAG: hypothetical protein HYZ20_01420 [Burkholderiales bacterium]|nr:hypothetical protein [Burkholderiales bacterium]
MPRSSPSPIITDRAEFIDALHLLARGRVLVQIGDGGLGWALDGAPVRFCAPTLTSYGLVDEFDNPEGFPGVRYYRLTERGQRFAEQAWRAWRRRSLVERALVRLVG